jgi:hypothetical protein
MISFFPATEIVLFFLFVETEKETESKKKRAAGCHERVLSRKLKKIRKKDVAKNVKI